VTCDTLRTMAIVHLLRNVDWSDIAKRAENACEVGINPYSGRAGKVASSPAHDNAP